jgi:hypothetical protein
VARGVGRSRVPPHSRAPREWKKVGEIVHGIACYCRPGEYMPKLGEAEAALHVKRLVMNVL